MKKMEKMIQIAESLDRTATLLADLLAAEKVQSAVILLFLPLA